MTALITTADLNITVNHEPRIRDLTIAEKLGMADPHKIRELVQSNREELESYGVISAQRAEITGAGRPGIEYYLNEAQALLLCTFSRTEKAAAVRRALIEAFMALRRGAAPPRPQAEPRLSVEQEKDLNRHASAFAQTHYHAIRAALLAEALRLLRSGKPLDIFALALPVPVKTKAIAQRRAALPVAAAPKPEFAWALWAEHVLDAYASAASCLQPDFPRMRAMAGSFGGVMRLLQNMERDGATVAAMSEAARNGGHILATETLGRDAANIDVPTAVAPLVASIMARHKPH